ncbi:MAG: alkaline phosphatase D family protein [Gemmatimonadaceae bacterium]|nr:alkaline phosphatase D family protein [Gemmatimonadaceae bacterium]
MSSVALRRFALALCLVASAASAQSPAPTIAAGPMVGASEMREVQLWVQTTAPARIQFVYWDTAAPGTKRRSAEVRTRDALANTAQVALGTLEPGRRYAYEVLINGKPAPRTYPLRFQTQALWQWRADPPAFRMALASCFYVNEPGYDRPGRPYGSEYEILDALNATAPDVMLWLGDNTYTREADWYSRSGFLARYSHTRALPQLQPLLGRTHHYATWDDHEYGPNDADRAFRDKRLALEAFNGFWANPAPALGPDAGVTTMFQWQDVDVFLLDDRWFRAPNNRKTGRRDYLGPTQLEWLIDQLTSSRAPFKLVAVGGQVLSPARIFENYANYVDEREQLLQTLAAERIPGVVFLTGDRHHTELTRLDRPGVPPLLDLTVSALTAGSNPNGINEPNTLRVPDTFVGVHNFGLLDFSGPRTDRVMTMSIRDVKGDVKWSRTIKASELR